MNVDGWALHLYVMWRVLDRVWRSTTYSQGPQVPSGTRRPPFRTHLPGTDDYGPEDRRLGTASGKHEDKGFDRPGRGASTGTTPLGAGIQRARVNGPWKTTMARSFSALFWLWGLAILCQRTAIQGQGKGLGTTTTTTTLLRAGNDSQRACSRPSR